MCPFSPLSPYAKLVTQLQLNCKGSWGNRVGSISQGLTREAELVGDIDIKSFIIRNSFIKLLGLDRQVWNPQRGTVGRGDHKWAGTHRYRLKLLSIGGLPFLSQGNLSSVFKAFQLIKLGPPKLSRIICYLNSADCGFLNYIYKLPAQPHPLVFDWFTVAGQVEAGEE